MRIALVCLIGLLSLARPAAAQNIVVNPGFEASTTSIAPWTLASKPPVFTWAAGNTATLAGIGLTPHSGSNAGYTGCANPNQAAPCVVIGASTANSLAQSLPTVAGNTYVLSFWVQNASTVGSIQPAELLVTWGGSTAIDLANPTPTASQGFLAGNAPGYTQYSVTVQATAASTALVFYGRNDPSWLAIDDVSVSPLITGKVIVDNGAGAGTANDGVQNGAEPGHAGVTVTLTNCAGTTYSTAITNAAGGFSLPTSAVPSVGVSLCVVESLAPGYVAVSNNPGATGGTYSAATKTLTFTLNATTNLNGIVFGDVPASTFLTNGNQQVIAGQTAVYAHTYTAGDNASVLLSSTIAANPAGSWGATLYLDSACSGALTASDSQITAPIAVKAGQTLCLLDKVTSPSGAPAGAVAIATLTATETYSPVPTNGATAHTFNLTDTTTISGSDVTLLKQVRVVATCPSTAADTTTFAASNQAAPGNYLEYQLTFANPTATTLSKITVADAVPAYTLFQSALCGPLPTGESGCAVTAPAVNASTGGIVWTFTDATTAPTGLQPGGSGIVRYCVKVTQ